MDSKSVFAAREKILTLMGQDFTFCCDSCPLTFSEMLVLVQARAHLDSRIRQQRHEITGLQAKARERNVRMERWHAGREALLREQLQQATSAMYGWKAESDRLRTKLKEAEALVSPADGVRR